MVPLNNHLVMDVFLGQAHPLVAEQVLEQAEDPLAVHRCRPWHLHWNLRCSETRGESKRGRVLFWLLCFASGWPVCFKFLGHKMLEIANKIANKEIANKPKNCIKMPKRQKLQKNNMQLFPISTYYHGFDHLHNPLCATKCYTTKKENSFSIDCGHRHHSPCMVDLRDRLGSMLQCYKSPKAKSSIGLFTLPLHRVKAAEENRTEFSL